MRNILPCLTKLRLPLVLASLLGSSLLASTPALAAGAEKDTPKAEDPTAGLKGFELMLRPSFGGAPSDSPVRFKPDPGVQVQGSPGDILNGASPWSPGFVGQAAVGYRFLPFLSAGLRAGIRTSSGSSVSDGSRDLSRTAWDAGFYVRAYPLSGVESISRYIDPWVATGVTYMRDTQSFSRAIPTTAGNLDGNVSLDHHSVAIPMAIGVDYRATKFLSVGPSFEYTLASAVAGCAKTTVAGNETSYCSNETPGSTFIKAQSYGVWTAGLDAKVTF